MNKREYKNTADDPEIEILARDHRIYFKYTSVKGVVSNQQGMKLSQINLEI
jgi:hypothetical protein